MASEAPKNELIRASFGLPTPEPPAPSPPEGKTRWGSADGGARDPVPGSMPVTPNEALQELYLAWRHGS